jgi:hypothetical protein
LLRAHDAEDDQWQREEDGGLFQFAFHWRNFLGARIASASSLSALFVEPAYG